MIFIKEYFQSFLKLAVYLAVSCFAKAVCFDPVSWKSRPVRLGLFSPIIPVN